MYQTNIIIKERELWDRFKDVAKDEGYTTQGALEKALNDFISKTSAPTRKEIRISKILKECPPGCKIYEKALHNILERDEFISKRQLDEIVDELLFRNIVTVHIIGKQRHLTFENYDPAPRGAES